MTAASVTAKVAWRLLPLMGALYLLAFLDRVNISFAALTMNAELGFSPSVFGNAAGIFFLGYVLFGVPSNLMLHRVGARRWVACVMITWGTLSALTAFMHTSVTFYTLRFLLGVAEAGYFPGMILYLTYWFPTHARGRILGAFMLALPLASVIGAPISSALLDLKAWNLSGWQWLFILEGVPTVLMGLVVLKFLTNRPEQARWLTAEERACLIELLEKAQTGSVTLSQAPANHTLWRLSLMYFAILTGLYGFNFWLPQIVQGFGKLTYAEVGGVAMIPNSAAAAVMYHWGKHSDATRDRRWHVALPAFAAAVGLTMTAVAAAQPAIALVSLILSAVGIYSLLPVFWTLPTATFSGTAAATAIALINALGSVGGYCGSWLMGYFRDATGNYREGLSVLAISMFFAGVLALTPGQRH